MDEIKEEEILKEFGKRLKKLRKAKKLSIRNFAYASELSVSYVQKLEEGASNPSFTTLIKILDTLNVEFSEFYSKK